MERGPQRGEVFAAERILKRRTKKVFDNALYNLSHGMSFVSSSIKFRPTREDNAPN